MSFFQAIILGIIEGLTEFLPISSTGHLILVTKLLNITSTDFVKSFEIAIQFGAILSVVVLYWNYLWRNLAIIPKLLAAFIPTAIVGLLAYPIIKDNFLDNEQLVIVSLFLGGLVLIGFEFWYKTKQITETNLNQITYTQAIIIGVFQSIAVIPGVSRAAATIFGGLILGYKRSTIVEFSFLLAIPTMLAATALDLQQSAPQFSRQEFQVLAVGFITSFIVAFIAVKSFLKFVEKSDFIPFGIYRVAIAVSAWIILF